MKGLVARFFFFCAMLSTYATAAFASRMVNPASLKQAAVPDRMQGILWVSSFISLLVPTFIFEKRQKEYSAKQVNIPLKHFALHLSLILPLVVMLIVYAVFMAVDFYSSCTPETWFAYSYILAGVLWLAMLQPAWLYLSIMKVEKFYIVKSHSPEFYENNRAFFDRWAKWLAFGLALFLALVALSSFYYMDRLNWANCQRGL